MQDNMYPD